MTNLWPYGRPRTGLFRSWTEVRGGKLPIIFQPSHQGFVVGFMGKRVYILHMYSMQCLEIPLTSQLLQLLDHKMFKWVEGKTKKIKKYYEEFRPLKEIIKTIPQTDKIPQFLYFAREAYALACLGITERDWRMLGEEALDHMEFTIAKKAFYRIHDCRSLMLINELEVNGNYILQERWEWTWRPWRKMRNNPLPFHFSIFLVIFEISICFRSDDIKTNKNPRIAKFKESNSHLQNFKSWQIFYMFFQFHFRCKFFLSKFFCLPFWEHISAFFIKNLSNYTFCWKNTCDAFLNGPVNEWKIPFLTEQFF